CFWQTCRPSPALSCAGKCLPCSPRVPINAAMPSAFPKEGYFMRLVNKAFCVAVSTAFMSVAVPAFGAAPAQKSALNMAWDVAMSPPYVFFLLVACSIFTATLIIERLNYYRRAASNTEALIQDVKRAGSPGDALNFISTAPGVAAAVMRATLQAAKDGCP